MLAHFAALPEVPPPMRDAIAAHAHADDAALAPLVPQLSLAQIQAILANEERLEGLNGFLAATLKRSDLPADLRTRLDELKQKHNIAQQELEAALAREEEEEKLLAEEQQKQRDAGDKVDD